MIFVTVGSQLPFDRLVMAIDEWAKLNPEETVVVQSIKSGYIPTYCELFDYIEPSKWQEMLNNAKLIVSHAGMGTILKCLDNKKPIVIMPRELKYNEIRNDHQLATIEKLVDHAGVYVTRDAQELKFFMQNIKHNNVTYPEFKSNNLDRLIKSLKLFVSEP